MKRLILLCAMLLTTSVSLVHSTTERLQSKKDIRTVVLTTTPQMHCENCENKIKGNIRFERGVKAIKTSVSDQTVTIQYDANKTTVDRLLKAFPKFGYEARQLKEDEKSKKNEN